jgi:hypothetical protein
VLRPGHNLPTMTLEEFAEEEMQKISVQQEKEAITKEIEDYNIKHNGKIDEDSDKIVDEKTYKDRNWDDWKDEHERGAGNKKTNIG